MKSEQQPVILKDNPEGYITDILEDSITFTKSNADYIQLKFIDLPDIGTITFSMELLNMAGPKHPQLFIETRMSVDTLNHTITDTQLPAIPVAHQIEKYVTLKYYYGNLRMVGRNVRIKYNGKPNIHVMYLLCLI